MMCYFLRHFLVIHVIEFEWSFVKQRSRLVTFLVGLSMICTSMYFSFNFFVLEEEVLAVLFLILMSALVMHLLPLDILKFTWIVHFSTFVITLHDTESAFTCNRDEISSGDEKISVYTWVSSRDEMSRISFWDEI